MENQSTLPNPDQIRQALTVQDENLQSLRALVSSITDENMRDLQKMLSERLRLLEDIERRLWNALFPKPADVFAAEHRMTMIQTTYIEQYY